jgi:hypothetical protein
MAAFDDDDDSLNTPFDDSPRAPDGGHGHGDQNSRRRRDSWDVEDPDSHAPVPDEMTTIRCRQCRKLFFEDSPRCPYCGHVQPESSKRPPWLLPALFAAIIIMGGLAAFYFLGILHWRIP